ncbi:MAG: MBL fold metallo-hydrolase [Promethearchaeota archaeon]
MILSRGGEVEPGLHLVDLHMFGAPQFGTAFVFVTDAATVIVDTGTSNEVFTMLKYLREHRVPVGGDREVLLVPSHHHFDHAGGMWRLYSKIRKKTSRVRVVTIEETMGLLQEPGEHLARARSTFGQFVGRMEPLPGEAYDLVAPGERVEIPGGSGYALELVPAPGHTPDHVCPTIYGPGGMGTPVFSFFGEACGTLYNTREVLTLATSMPPLFEWEPYMETLGRLKQLHAPTVGFCHFGGISGASAVADLIREHEGFMLEFRRRVEEAYGEKPETRHVVGKIHPWFGSRTSFDASSVDNSFLKLFENMSLALVYGMLKSLGLR